MPDREIRRTLAEYCQLLDDGRFDEWSQLFADDVTFAVMGQVLHGRDAVRGMIEPTQQADARGRHMLSEPLIDVDGETARVTTDFCFVSKELTVLAAGRYHDVLVHDGARWRFAAREIVFVGDEPIGVAGDG
jgi:3-phenylpropionate/cinnamic acid dioxygenase small subunit